MVVGILISGIIAYLLGSISFSVIFSKKMVGIDVREQGSKNAGTTNVLRVAGKKAAIFTLVLDILKGVIAVFLALIIGNIAKLSNNEISVLLQVAGVLVILGHTFPIFFRI